MEEVKNEVQKDAMGECAAQLNSAAQALERVIGKLEAQYEALNQKIDRIIATVEKQAADNSAETVVEASAQPDAAGNPLLPTEGRNGAPAVRVERKTLPAVVSTLLAKSGVGESAQIESCTLDRALGALTIEQRIAVKAELARAGMIA